MSQYPNQQPVDMRRIEAVVSRIFPSMPSLIEHVTEGVSTYVYRVTFLRETFYLRILPEEGVSFAPEAEVHAQLRQMQIKVPEVIYYEAYNDLLQRSIMVTTEIRGRPISQSQSLSAQELEGILVEAGHDLAGINSLAVSGFGWMKRDMSDRKYLQAERPTYCAFALEYWEADLAYLCEHIISASEVAQLEGMLARCGSWLDVEQGYLAHGDFDTSHIYQEHGRYTGIIDFGEMRGAERWYDLGHFHLRDGERMPLQLVPFLVRGYGEIVSLQSECEAHICFASLLINVRSLARSLQKRPLDRYIEHQLKVLREDLEMIGGAL